MKNIYNEPFYYEIAFDFVDIPAQIDLFEEFIGEYSRIEVKRFLDICCGPSLQLREIARRGDQAVGLDLSSCMLQYLSHRFAEEKLTLETIEANMNDFVPEKRVDFAFIMMGSFQFPDTKNLLAHLDKAAGALNRGGLYLIENMALDWPNLSRKPPQWSMERDGIIVDTTYRMTPVDTLEQTSREKLVLEVDDHGRKIKYEDERIIRNIFPQEFLALLQLNGKFEFIGWFERFTAKRLVQAVMDNNVLLRRK